MLYGGHSSAAAWPGPPGVDASASFDPLTGYKRTAAQGNPSIYLCCTYVYLFTFYLYFAYLIGVSTFQHFGFTSFWCSIECVLGTKFAPPPFHFRKIMLYFIF